MNIRTLVRTLQAHRRARFELARLGDRELHDLGIPRWRIDEIARGEAIDPRQVL